MRKLIIYDQLKDHLSVVLCNIYNINYGSEEYPFGEKVRVLYVHCYWRKWLITFTWHLGGNNSNFNFRLISGRGLAVSLSRAWCLSFWVYGLRFTFYGLRFTFYDIRFTDYGLQFMVIQLWAISFGTGQHLISFLWRVFLMTMQHRLANIIFSTIMIWHLSPRRQLQSTSTYSCNVDVSSLKSWNFQRQRQRRVSYNMDNIKTRGASTVCMVLDHHTIGQWADNNRHHETSLFVTFLYKSTWEKTSSIDVRMNWDRWTAMRPPIPFSFPIPIALLDNVRYGETLPKCPFSWLEVGFVLGDSTVAQQRYTSAGVAVSLELAVGR